MISYLCQQRNSLLKIESSLGKLLKSPIVLDVETTTRNKGNPFDLSNKLIIIGYGTNKNQISTTTFKSVIPILNSASVIIGANLKFDLNWLFRELNYNIQCPTWDIQLAEFILSNQKWRFPDVATMAINYEVGHKLEYIKENYWDKGIDTDQIPLDELIPYCDNDISIEYSIFLEQVERFRTTDRSKYALFRLQCNDQIVLQEMERNGIYYDEDESQKQAAILEHSCYQITEELIKLSGIDSLNFNSNDDISRLLYGGSKIYKVKLPVGFIKSGPNKGNVKYKLFEEVREFPRLVEPLKGSELLKPGFYKTDIQTLLSLSPNKKAKRIIELLIEYSKLQKIISTYLIGLPKLREEMNWPPGKLYSTLNQCIAITSRLSSNKPNQQNFLKEAKKCCISRYN